MSDLTPAALPGAAPVPAGSPGHGRLSPTLMIGAVLVAVVVAAALLSFFWTPYDPVRAVPEDRLLGSSGAHLKGTDR